MPKKVSVVAEPTVRWKWPGIHVVLWTARFMLYEALVIPLMPPNANRIMAKFCAA